MSADFIKMDNKIYHLEESLIQKLKIGSDLNVILETIGKNVTGNLEEILPAINPGSRSLRIRVALPETAGLLTGMFGRLEIPIGKRQYLLVPAEAIETMGQLQFAIVKEANGTSKRKTIKIGRKVGEQFEVLTDPSAFNDVTEALEAAGIPTLSAEVGLVPTTLVPIADKSSVQSVLKFVNTLEDNDDVQNVYTNMDVEDAIMQELAEEE